MKKINAAIFDLDGTLLNTITDICDSLNQAIQENGCVQHYSDKECMRLVGSGVNQLIARALPGVEDETLKAKVLQDYSRIYAANSMKKTRPYPDLPYVLKILVQEGIKIAVVSNKPDADTKKLVRFYYPDVMFSFVAGHRAEMPHKPDPAIAYAALGAMNETAEHTAFIGDSDVDMQTGRNAGMTSIGVLWGFRSEEELRSAGAQDLAGNPTDLIRIILNHK